MRYVITFNDTGTEGVFVFSAESLEDAYTFIRDPKNFYRPDRVSDPVPFSGDMRDLYALFPGRKKELRQ